MADQTKVHNFNEKESSMLDSLKEVFRVELSSVKKIKSVDLCKRLNAHTPDINWCADRLRKFCRYYRSEGLLPIITTSDGYYISYDVAEIASQVANLRGRAKSSLEDADGLEKFLTNAHSNGF